MKTKPTFPNLCSLLCLSNYFSVFLLFCLLVSLGELFAQPVTLDPTFGENGMTVLPVKGKISLIDFDKHGNIIAVGVTNIEGKDYLTIVKTNANGILDQNFGTNGKITILGYIPEVEVSPIGLKITKENKILINGSFDIIDQGTRRRMFMQFNGDGSFDETFGENGKIFLTMGGTYTRAVNLENDDFMWIGGNVASTFLPFISKYNYNGEIDESFGENGKLYLTDNETFNITPHAIKILHDNTILVAGSNYSEVAFCKITQGGNFVTDFANNGIWKKHIYTDPHSETWVSFVDAIEDHNGNLTLLGTCFEIRPNFAKSFVCHFHPDGNISSNFGVDGFYYYSWFFSTNIDSYLLQKILQNENRYIIGACYKVISLLPDGTIDTSFNNTGVYNCENFTFKDFKLQRKDKLILGGTNGNFAIIRLQIPAHLSVDAGGNQHFCYDGGDFKEAILGGNPTALGGTPPYTYRWWCNDENCMISDPTAANPSIFHLGGITVSVEVKDAENNTAIDSAVLSMSQIPYSFLNTPDYLPIEYYISKGDSIWISIDTIVQIHGNSTCKWDPIIGLENSHTCSNFWAKPEVTTSYFLTVTDEYGCSELVSPSGNTPIYKVSVNVGVKEYEDSNAIFPNPVKEYLHFSKETKFEIMDIQGKILMQSKKATQSVNVSRLKAGVYFITFENSKVVKFVKE